MISKRLVRRVTPVFRTHTALSSLVMETYSLFRKKTAVFSNSRKTVVRKLWRERGSRPETEDAGIFGSVDLLETVERRNRPCSTARRIWLSHRTAAFISRTRKTTGFAGSAPMGSYRRYSEPDPFSAEVLQNLAKARRLDSILPKESISRRMGPYTSPTPEIIVCFGFRPPQTPQNAGHILSRGPATRISEADLPETEVMHSTQSSTDRRM